jgi:hypothetical protein
MIRITVLAGLTAAFAMCAAAAAQTTGGPDAVPTAAAKQPLGSTTPSGTPYSESGSALPSDPSDTSRMNSSANAAQHGADSAAQTRDSSDAAAIDRCKAMPSDAMMKDRACAKLMKKHPTMMNGADSSPQ